MLTTSPCRYPACSSVLCASRSGRWTLRLGQTGFNPEGEGGGSGGGVNSEDAKRADVVLEPLKELLSPRLVLQQHRHPGTAERRATPPRLLVSFQTRRWLLASCSGRQGSFSLSMIVILWIEAYRRVFIHSRSPGARIVHLCPTGAVPSPAPGALPSRGQPCCSCGRPHVQPPPPHLLGVCRSLTFIVNIVGLWFYPLVALFLNVEI